MATNVTNENAKEFMATELPIVLDFSAAWCGPCKQLAPIIEELSEEYAGRIAVGKCDIEEADDLTMEYGIRNVPTVIFIKNGQIVERFVGYKSKSDVQAKFEALLG
jgi:thioredoxin 1